jgi:hypothetical protein
MKFSWLVVSIFYLTVRSKILIKVIQTGVFVVLGINKLKW